MTEKSFEGRVFKIYNKWTFVDIFIADGAMLGILLLYLFDLWYLFPFILMPAAYMITWGSPNRPVWHFIETYMAVGEPQSADVEFIRKIKPRFDVFGLWSPWKDFDAVFV